MNHREPVLGIHDLAPPEGRVTIELLDERGLKVVQRERSDNLILNWHNDIIKRTVRGAAGYSTANGIPVSYGYHFHGSSVDQGFGMNTDGTPVLRDIGSLQAGGGAMWWVGMQSGLPQWVGPNSYQAINSIILSDSTVAAHADEAMFPGDIAAFCYMPENSTGTSIVNFKRTNLNQTSCQRTPSYLRYVAEWGPNFGNGTINSVGLGNTNFPINNSVSGIPNYCWSPPNMGLAYHTGVGYFETPTSQGAGATNLQTYWPWISTNAGGGNVANLNFIGANTVPTASVPVVSGHRVANDEYWLLCSGVAGNNLFRYDMTTVTAASQPFANATAGVSVTGPTMTTIGAAANRCAVTAIGADLWLAYTGTLKRCVKPTSTTLSVTDTYTPATIENCVDITTDGTDIYWLGATRVYKINPATGAITSSWLHGLPGTMYNICYLGAPTGQEGLVISYLDTSLTATVYNFTPFTFTGFPMRCDRFTLAGARTPGWVYSFAMSTTTASYQSGLVMPLSGDGRHFYGFHGGASQAHAKIAHASHMSRTVLGAPVVKTLANSLRCVYEFGFS